MVIHLWGKFFHGGLAGGAAPPHLDDRCGLRSSPPSALLFTGYLVQTNFDSQWIASEAKDGINSIGVGPSSTS